MQDIPIFMQSRLWKTLGNDMRCGKNLLTKTRTMRREMNHACATCGRRHNARQNRLQKGRSNAPHKDKPERPASPHLTWRKRHKPGTKAAPHAATHDRNATRATPLGNQRKNNGFAKHGLLHVKRRQTATWKTAFGKPIRHLLGEYAVLVHGAWVANPSPKGANFA